MTPNIIRSFRSLTDWIDFADYNASPEHGRCDSQTPRKAWAGVSTKEEAFQLFRNGHPEGCERMKRVLAELQSNFIHPTTQDVFECDVSGCAPNVEAYIQGIPEDMFVISQIAQDAPPSNLTVQFELAYACHVSAAQATMAGCIVFAAMEALRQQGCNVTALVSHTTQQFRTGSTWQATVPVPTNLDMDSLAFLFTHPAMLRVLVFSIMEHEPKNIRDLQGFYGGIGYGRPVECKNPDADAIISMVTIANQLGPIPDIPQEQDFAHARAILKRLIETRFGTHNPTEPAAN